ncbi:MAG: hypothetical protein AAGA56_20450 [Myxococcota bacterium]
MARSRSVTVMVLATACGPAVTNCGPRVPSASSPGVTVEAEGWRCGGAGEARRVNAVIGYLFFNDDFDDAGVRTEFELRAGDETHDFALYDDRTDVLKEGMAVEAVLRWSTWWYGEPGLDLVELWVGSTLIERYDHAYSVASTLDVKEGRLRFRDAGQRARWLPVPSAVADLKLDPATKYDLDVYVAERDGRRCVQLVAITVDHPTKTMEMFDARLGPYEVPARQVLWKRE